jgi:hypothetical protein
MKAIYVHSIATTVRKNEGKRVCTPEYVLDKHYLKFK